MFKRVTRNRYFQTMLWLSSFIIIIYYYAKKSSKNTHTAYKILQILKIKT